MKAMILAAGLGTRLKPLTETKPKALAEVNGIPIIEFTIKKLIKCGFEKIIINVHHFPDQIINFLQERNYFGIEIKISDERDLLLDTGGGLKKASAYFDDGRPFLIHNADIFSEIDLKKFYEFHLKSDSEATLAVQKRESSRYFLFDEQNILCGWKNVKTGEEKITRPPEGNLSALAFSGVQILNPSVLNFMPDKQVFSLVDFYLSIASKKRISYFDHSDSVFIDLGKKENLDKAAAFLNGNY